MTGPAPTYVQMLRDPRWQRRRNEILIRDNYRCVWCKDTENNLQVDHRRYRKGAKPWEYEDRDLQTLCASCHERITKLRRRVMDMLGDFNVYELPIVIAGIENQWSGCQMVSSPAPAPAPRADRTAGIRAELARLDREANSIRIDGEWTKEESRGMDDIDARRAEIWDRLADDYFAQDVA